MARSYRPKQLIPGLLRQLRQKDGWTQEDLATRCKADVRQYRRYEAGEVHEITRADQYDFIERIAAALGVTPEQLLAQNDQASPPATFPSPPDSSYDPAYYIPYEPHVRKALSYLAQAGTPVVLQGPTGYGKAALLGHLLDRTTKARAMVDATYSALRIDLSSLDAQATDSLDDLLRALAWQLLSDDAAQAGDCIQQAWQRPGTVKSRFDWLMEQHILPCQSILYLALEKAERLLDVPFQHEFFALLRSWQERRREPWWSRLRLIVTVATEPGFLECTDHSSFFALSCPIRLEGLNSAQVAALADLHAPRPSHAAISQLMALLQGHPYLVRLALHEAASRAASLEEILAEVSPGGGVFALHLARLRRWLGEQRLLSTVTRVLAGPVLDLDLREYCKLYSQGIVIEDRPGTYRLRCRLYEEYFGLLCLKP